MALVLVAIAATGIACGSEDTGGTSGEIEVVATDLQFDTNELEIEPGSSAEVTLTNDGEAEHSFSVEELDLEVEAEGGETATGTLEAPDEDVTYEFFCEYHPDQMRGTLIVGAGGEAPAGGGGGGEAETEEETPTEDATETETEDETEKEGDNQGGYDY
jgi:plastocyanin